MKSSLLRSGFSLIEVVLAIGIVSFALLAVVGLLPVGMKSTQNAREQAAAANVLNSIANALRSAETSDGINFSNSFADKIVAYKIQGGISTVDWSNLDLNGQTDSTSPRLKAYLVITPPPNSTSTGEALISIAWPAQNPNMKWVGSEWTNAQGHLTTRIHFFPGQ